MSAKFNEKRMRERGFDIEFQKSYQKLFVPESFASVDDFALNVVYKMRLFVASKLKCSRKDVVLVAHAKDDMAVFICEDDGLRNWVKEKTNGQQTGSALFYKFIKVENITEAIDEFYNQ